jgi:hypothetical protein
VKVFISLFYFFRSVVLRGFSNTLKLILAENEGEKKFAISTSSIKKSESPEFFHYQGASYQVLSRIYDLLAPQTNTLNFVDI